MPELPYVCICKKCGMQFMASSHHHPFCKSCIKAKRNPDFYPRVFWKNRLIVLERDDHTCQCCGCKQDSKQTNKLCIHHIDGDRQNNSPSNLITLCTQCHLSLHHKFTKYELRRSNIYKLFSTDIRFGEFGKILIYGASKQLVKKQFKGKPKLFFKKSK
jgi:hypothetical protein